MKLAFCLFNYFPYGGLQRDFLRIAKAMLARGHDIHVYTMRWEGECEPGLSLHLIKARGWTNHSRIRSYVRKLQAIWPDEAYDLIIGFNKMPGLDIYYAADVCYEARIRESRPFFYRWLPRYQYYAAFEKAVFAKANKTQIFLISPKEQQRFTHYYQTEVKRFNLLPPGINKDLLALREREEQRAQIRKAYHIPQDDYLLLMVGSGFKTKGVDRAIKALASLPSALQARCHLLIIGKDHPGAFLKLAKKYHVVERVHFLGGRSDVPDFLLAADLLLHPAYHENTGTVLLEALASGLAVLTVEACGYAPYVKAAKAGVVLPAPFQQTDLDAGLQNLLLSSELKNLGQRGLAYAKGADIYHLPEVAADKIESIAKWLGSE